MDLTGNEPRSNVYDALPRRNNPNNSVDTTRKGFANMSEKEINRIVEHSGETEVNKGALKREVDDHVGERLGPGADPGVPINEND